MVLNGLTRFSVLTAALPLLLGIMSGAGVPATAAVHPPAPVLLAQSQVRVSLGEAVERVVRQTGGQIISAKTITRQGRTVHRIRVLVSEGRVRVYEVDASTGSIR